MSSDWFPEEEVISRGWREVEAKVARLADLPSDWDEGGAAPVEANRIRSALILLRELPRLGFTPVQDVYPLPDGIIVFEWQFADARRTIHRILIEAVGRGDFMTSCDGAKPTHLDIHWSATGADPAGAFIGPSWEAESTEGPYGLQSFGMAA